MLTQRYHQSNDVNYLKTIIPVSSMKFMDGEDLSYGDRKMKQQLQQRLWIQQQIQEKNQFKHREIQTNREYDRNSLYLLDLKKSMEDAHHQKRKNMTFACKSVNQIQFAQKKEYEEQQKKVDQTEKKMHNQYFSNTKFMKEDTDTCASALGSHRVVPYHWKGMNSEQKQDVYFGRESQILEQKVHFQTKQKYKYNDIVNNLFANQTENQRLMAVKLERQAQNKRQNSMNQIKEFNLILNQEKKHKFLN